MNGVCRNFVAGHCRFGQRCKYAHHTPNVVQELFAKLELGSKPHESIKVGLNSKSEQELKEFLSMHVGYEQTAVANSDCNEESEEDDNDANEENLAFEKMLKEKYGHIPDSSFKNTFLENIRGNYRSGQGSSAPVLSSFVRNPPLDYTLKYDLENKIKSSYAYQRTYETRKSLPIYKCKDKILNTLEKNNVIVISGETGSGKTTQVAQFILDDFITQGKGSLCHIVCTQPRRISATSVAERVSYERDEICGGEENSVGYQIRLKKKLPRARGSIVFVTTGILFQWMLRDPGLRQVSHILIDEVHERNTDSDFVLTILREIVKQRTDLKIIIMSATLNSKLFSTYFDNCPFIEVPGYSYPVTELHLEDILQMTGYIKEPSTRTRINRTSTSSMEDFYRYIVPFAESLRHTYGDAVIKQILNPESERRIDLELIVKLIEHICSHKPPGGILIFLPGWETIANLCKLIHTSTFFNEAPNKKSQATDGNADDDDEEEEDEEGMCDDDELFQTSVTKGKTGRYLILPLHSKLPTVNHNQVFEAAPVGVRKIIISTNIAETSITIDDIVYIIDCGKMKIKKYDPEANLNTLQDEWVSKANALQRKGRAGRCQAGECYRLYTKARYRLFNEYPVPEILRTRLEELILNIKLLQLGKVAYILSRVLSCPDMKNVNTSVKLLQTLDALDEDENLTPLGFHLAKLPLDPHVGKMILYGAIFSCLDPVLSIAACLSFKEPFVTPMGSEKLLLARKTELSKGTRSDHLVCAEIIKQWEQRRKGLRKFYKRNFLSVSTLHSLRDLKLEFVEYLSEMEFIKNKNFADPAVNMNSDNLTLIKAVICAGLYPNVAIVRRVAVFKILGSVDIEVITLTDERVRFHKTSINTAVTNVESPYFIYHNKMKSSYIFLHDTTMVPSLPLIFFGHHINYNASKRVISINDRIVFNCPKGTAEVIQILKEAVQKVLHKIFVNPDTIDWSSNDGDPKILRAAVQLMVQEDEDLMKKKDTPV